MTCNPIPFTDIGNVLVATSSTRPTGDQRYVGRVIYETDTGRIRTWNGSNWVGNGEEGYAEITSNSATQTTLADVTGLSVTWTADASRKYLVNVHYMLLSNTNNTFGNVWIRNASNTQLSVNTVYLANASFAAGGVLTHRMTGISGSYTVKVSIDNAGGANNVRLTAASVYPSSIQVIDVT